VRGRDAPRDALHRSGVRVACGTELRVRGALARQRRARTLFSAARMEPTPLDPHALGDATRTAQDSRPGALHYLLLVALLALAAWSRVGLADRMAPQRPEPDAYLALQLDVLTHNVPSGKVARDKAERLYGAYPDFLVRPLAALTGGSVYARASLDAPLAEHLEAAARPLVTVRAWCAWICAAGVLATYLLARQWLAPRAALVAAALVSFSLLHLAYSHQARPHAPHMTFAALALAAASAYAAKPSGARLTLAGVALWAGFASLQTGLFLAPAFFVALVVARAPWRPKLAALVVLGAAYALAQPFHAGGVEFSSAGISMANDGHAVDLSELNGRGAFVTWSALWGNDPALLVFALLGLAIALYGAAVPRGEPRTWLVPTAYVVPYLAFALLNEATRDRYLIPMLPCLAIAAAIAIEGLAQRAARRSELLGAALVAAALAAPVLSGLRYVFVARRPDTLELAAAWLERQPNAAEARIVTSPYAVLPLAWRRAALDNAPRRLADQSAWLTYQLALGAAPAGAPLFDFTLFAPAREGREGDEEQLRARLDALAPTYVVLEPSRRQRSFPWHEAFERVVRAHAQRVALFEPDGEDPPRDELFEYGDIVGLRSRLAGAHTFGPPLEIYLWNPR